MIFFPWICDRNDSESDPDTFLNGRPHEKADPAVVHTLRQILEPARTEAEHASELLEDEDTTWFGFGRDSAGQPVFYDYGRFSAIMSELVSHAPGDIYPQLVSVIGETGAGKSTLIKMLIDRQAPGARDGSRYYSPVTSSNQDRTATTGDVHIYADPSSAFSTTPLLFVDCEGLNGGEAMPKQLRHHHHHHMQPSQDQGLAATPGRSSTPAAAAAAGAAPPPPYEQATPTTPAADHGTRPVRPRHVSKRPIAWARTPQTRRREHAVSQLYPRVLYTFSDVVVFVLRNPRSFESTVLGRLVSWGARSIDASLNQPALPHAVVVLNATAGSVDEGEWDVATATARLLADVEGAVRRDPALQAYAAGWARRGREIRGTADLLACYYASVSVVRVPHTGAGGGGGGSYMLMDAQAGKLMGVVRARCAEGHAARRRLRMLATAERLGVYLQAAYDHFTRSLDAPFDFVREALRKFPAARNFQGNVLSLAVAVRDNSNNNHNKSALVGAREDGGGDDDVDARRIFLAMAPMIASCVMLDAVRQNLLGTATRLLDDKYAGPCAAALQTFADMYWPCSFSSPGLGEAGRCCNVRSGHNPKGHQNAQGKVIASGSYQSSLDPEAFAAEWLSQIRRSLDAIEATMAKLSQAYPGRAELVTAALVHRERLDGFYRAAGGATAFASHSACLSCLRELPECALPCGHVLCLPCLELYGTRASRTCVEISRCPLHGGDVVAEPPWAVAVKPARAGVRVLCLDGGGVRGLVQLRVLREIERVLGPGLPIQLFFDLMVGTNTGGIIAIGLGVKRWTVEAATDKFRDICREAFTPREMQRVPLIGALTKMYHGSVFKTQPLERILKRYFSDTPFFGGARSRHGLNTPVKVAVTATTAFQPVVFANYNRPDPVGGKAAPYQFIRSDVPSKELSVWEVARAASAAPPFFKPFVAPETNTEYADGTRSHGCPAKVAHAEARAIWPDAADLPPDMMLSIGTGRVEGEQAAASRPPSRSSRSTASTTDAPARRQQPPTVTKSATTPVPLAGGQMVRSGRGGVGNYKRVETTPASASAVGGPIQTGIFFVRDPKTPLLLSFAPKQHHQPPPPDHATSTSDDGGLYNHRRCEHAWEGFAAGHHGHGEADDDDDGGRYARISPALLASQVPRFEEAARMEELERDVEVALRREEMVGAVVLAAHRLVASTFFFEAEGGGSTRQGASSSSSGYVCTGSIFCRFRQSSPELMALGSFLRSCCAGDFRPYFLVEDDMDDDSGGGTRRRRQIILSDALVLDMQTAGYFDLEPLTIFTADTTSKHGRATSISLTLQMEPYSRGDGATTCAAALPISGFPRRLVSEESGGGQGGGIAARATARAAVPPPPPPGGGGGEHQRNTNNNAGEVVLSTTADAASVSAMSSASPGRPLSPDSVSPITTYTLASRSSTGSTSLGGGAAGLVEKPRRHGGEVIAELPDHGSQAAELPSG
ncbi:hypothetical protein KVR01_008061 [Diaporthe batatas]|uniref:uncharacterized protein n=1 Tax=Diaporthe batatas TaxID=748121 RepID=UPI001D03F039|nr:uncharacterized protein KVR01_008061 [Diaporthe batatas]KAG8162296.1 hypothetical protein KVR01_008061 [Diaporthe batatas]